MNFLQIFRNYRNAQLEKSYPAHFLCSSFFPLQGIIELTQKFILIQKLEKLWRNEFKVVKVKVIRNLISFHHFGSSNLWFETS